MTKHKISTKSTVEATIAVDAAHHRLTWKQEAFVNHYVATGNATEAYRRSYACQRMAAKSIETEALRLLKHPGITLAIDHYRRNRAMETMLSFEQHMAKLRELRDTATANGKSAIEPGDFLPIQLVDKSFAVGRVIQLPSKRGPTPDPYSSQALWPIAATNGELTISCIMGKLGNGESRERFGMFWWSRHDFSTFCSP